ncbi:hypothetical protein CFM90_11080 [Ralstonia solanacearum]|nr:hypothetical protein CFM90_11080 [Ralstonia solanacearum]
MAEPGPMMERFDRWPPIELRLSQVDPQETDAPPQKRSLRPSRYPGMPQRNESSRTLKQSTP